MGSSVKNIFEELVLDQNVSIVCQSRKHATVTPNKMLVL